MKKIVAVIDFEAYINGEKHSFIKGDVIESLTYEQITRLNEMGFIEPLEHKDLVLIKRELDKKKEEL